MDRTNDFEMSAALPVAQSQGYAYASVIQADVTESKTPNASPIGRPKQFKEVGFEPMPFSQIAVGAVAGLVGPFVAATLFLLLSNY